MSTFSLLCLKSVETVCCFFILWSPIVSLLLRGRGGCDGIWYLQLPMQPVCITTNVVSLNTAQARCTRYNIMWSRLSVTYDRSVVFSGYSCFLNQLNWFSWTIVESGIKHNNPKPSALCVDWFIISHEVNTLSFCIYNDLIKWNRVSDCCLMPSKQYHCENKLVLNEMMMRSAFCKTNKLSWIFYSANALDKQSTDRNIAPIGRIILI